MLQTVNQILTFHIPRESIIEYLAALTALATILVLWKQKRSPEVRYLILVELFAAIWAFTYGFELNSHTLYTKTLWSQISYAGIAFLPVSYFLFTTAYSQKNRLLNPVNIALLSIIPFITLLLVFTNKMHHLVWSDVYLVPELNLAHYEHGIWFWIFWIYSFALIIGGIFNLLQAIWKFTAYYKSQITVLLVATSIPLAGNLMYVTRLNPVPGFDWTPALFIFSGLIVTFGIVRYRMFDLVPFARNKLIETMEDGVLVVNAEGFIEDCNSSVFQIFHLEQKSVIRESFKKLFSEFRDFSSSLGKKGINTLHIAVPQEKGYKYYQTRISPVFDRKNRFSGHFIQIHDITDMKMAEKQLKKTNQHMQAEIEKRGKLIDDLEAFSHTVAHDLKNSLGSIFSSTGILEENIEGGDPEMLKELAGLMKNSASKAMHITRELLILSTVSHQEIEKKPLDMEAIFSEAISQLRQIIKDFGARIKSPETWPYSIGHAPWVEEVWANYLSNAIKYGGTPPVIEVGADLDGNNRTKYWIKDNGKGLTPAEQKKLFRKYARLDPEKAEGYGLGLSIVKRITEKLGGTVGIESSGIPGEGSLFYFTLPQKN